MIHERRLEGMNTTLAAKNNPTTVVDVVTCHEKSPMAIGNAPTPAERVHFEREEHPIRRDEFEKVGVIW